MNICTLILSMQTQLFVELQIRFITLSAVNTHVHVHAHVQYMEDHICLTSQTICIYSNRFSAALQS